MRTGSIDFRAFVTGMALLTSKDPDHRAELLFSLSDLNKNGVIERFEMFSIVKSLADAAQQLGGEFPPPPGQSASLISQS